MKQLTVNIVENKRIAPEFYRMRVESAYLAKNAKPGQFVEVKCSDGAEPLLRRPLGVHRILDNGIEVLYQIAGKGTELLSRKNPGGMLDLIGPLGNGFSVPRIPTPDPRLSILVAGGIGVAPLVALAEELIDQPATFPDSRLTVLIGACAKEHVVCENDFKKLGAKVFIATEDGSMGKKGLVTDLLKEILRANSYERRITIYSCGPAAMLKAVAGIAEAERVPCQVSLEERMACGVGVCLGCPVRVKTLPVPDRTSRLHVLSGTGTNGYKMVCKDGPVFDAKELIW